MATQIIQVDLHSIPASIPVRDDVSGVLVAAMADGCAVDLFRLPRPVGGALFPGDILPWIGNGKRSGSPHGPYSGGPITIVVPTRERPDDLSRCLESLAVCRAAGHEVIVVDNAPVTARTAQVAERYRVRLVSEPAPGLNRARNAGVAHASHQIVAFVDDDVVVSPQWADAIREGFADPAVGCVTGLVLPLELETAAQEEFEIYSQHRRVFERRVYSRDRVRASSADVVGIGANMAYRRDLAIELGGFDVRLDAGTRTRAGGDTDMFARVLDADRLIAYSPEAMVWHRHRRTSREVTSCAFGYGTGTFGMLTKRVVERGDFGAMVTAARWVGGTVLKAVRAKVTHLPSPRWQVIVAEWAGAACGPFCFAYEAWRHRARRGAAAADSTN